MSKISFIFPGQGSQSIGMLSALSQAGTIIQQTFEEASDVVHYDVWQLTQTGPLTQLNETTYTQVAMLTADVAVYRLIQDHFALIPMMMAGHSLGEYAALVAAQAISFQDALRVVQQRRQLMQSTIPLGMGAMAAVIGLDNAEVERLCQQVSLVHDRVMPANYNAVGQVVVAGHVKAVERLIEAAEGMNARLATLIPVSVPCHCDLLKEAAMAFASVLHEIAFAQPMYPVLSNIDAKPYVSPEAIRLQLAAQLYEPVQWVETVRSMAMAGCVHLIECGPGQVLSGLVKRIDRALNVLSVNGIDALEKLRGWCDVIERV